MLNGLSTPRWKMVLVALVALASAGRAQAQTLPIDPPVASPFIASGEGATWGVPRLSITGIQGLGWKIGVDLGDFDPIFKTSVRMTRPLVLAGQNLYVASATQRATLSIARPVGSGLFPNELAEVQKLTQIIAYRVKTLPADEAAARKVFDFAKSWKAETVIVERAPASLVLADKLAEESQLAVAICGPVDKIAAALRTASDRVGACIDTAALGQGVTPAQAIATLKDRLLLVQLRDRKGAAPQTAALGDGDVNFKGFFGALYASGEKPPLMIVRSGGAAADPAVDVRRSLTYLNTAFLPVVAQQMMKNSRVTPTKATDSVPEDLRNQIDAGIASIPASAIATPKKSRELLVIDLNAAYPGHKSIPAHNYALQALAARTKAFTPVFDNNLDNLKYSKIKQSDAIFLNNTVGPIFSDPEVRAGLLRYMREGGGLVGIHASSHASMDWPEFGRLLGGWGGVHRMPTEKVWLKLDDPSSPINAAFGGKPALAQDEIFRFTDFPYDRHNVHVLLSIDVAATDMRPFELGREDADYAVSWIHKYGQGRVFYTTLGHNPTLFAVPLTAQHVLAGIQYALGDVQSDATPEQKPTHVKKSGQKLANVKK
jgi:type 1 glutamine amidotransferase